MGRRNKEINIENFLNEKGQIKFWPAKRKKQLIILEYLKDKIEEDIDYSEKEINELLKSLHLFNDWVLLRRELIDQKYLIREKDGSIYRKNKKKVI